MVKKFTYQNFTNFAQNFVKRPDAFQQMTHLFTCYDGPVARDIYRESENIAEMNARRAMLVTIVQYLWEQKYHDKFQSPTTFARSVNTPAQICRGISAISKNPKVTQKKI